MRTPVLSLLLALLILSSCGHEKTQQAAVPVHEKTIKKELLQEDFRILRTSLEETHPGLYDYITKDSLDHLFDAAYASLDHDMTPNEFFRLISPLVKKIYCEHTFVDVSFGYDSIRKFMPVKVRFVNGIAYVYKNLLNHPQLVPGTEITSINGRSPKDILQDIKTFYSSTNIDDNVEHEVQSLHFDYLYGAFFEQPDTFRIAVKDPLTKEPHTVTLPAIVPADSAHFLPIYLLANAYANKDSCYRFRIDKVNDVAVMTITDLSSDAVDASGLSFPGAFNRDFKKMAAAHTGNLVIDLRYNWGGDPKYGAALLTHFCGKPFHIFDTLRAVLKNKPTFANDMDISDTHYANWDSITAAAKTVADPSARRTYYSGFRDTLFVPAAEQFKGHVYLIINSEIHSAAAITTALIDHYSDATIAGSPTPGPYASGNALEPITLTLPNTKLRVYLPLFHYSYTVPHNRYPSKTGIRPDIFVQPAMRDILEKKDPVFDSIIALIHAQAR